MHLGDFRVQNEWTFVMCLRFNILKRGDKIRLKENNNNNIIIIIR